LIETIEHFYATMYGRGFLFPGGHATTSVKKNYGAKKKNNIFWMKYMIINDQHETSGG